MNPRVTKVKPGEAIFELELTFSNGEEKVFDLKPYLETGRFVQLKNEANFCIRGLYRMGSIEWQKWP